MSTRGEATTLAPYFARWFDAGAADTLLGDRYAVRIRGGGVLELPLRALPDGQRAIALLMTNQTDFHVEAHMARVLCDLAERFYPEAIVGLPTMGLDYARLVARELGFESYTALGFSRKFWYDDRLCERATSITSPGEGKALYLDPALLDRVAGKRVVLIDDVINTGGTAAAAIRLLERSGAQAAGLVVGLTEGHAWPERVAAAGHIPMFRRTGGGWEAIPETAALSP